MKRILLLCLPVLIIIYACNNAANTATTDTLTDTASVQVDSSAVYDTAIDVPPADTVLIGFYKGLLPCKDCQGINHTLLLKRTGLFSLEELILGKGIFPEKRQGRWTRKGDSLRLMANQKMLATYYIKQDTLLLADFDGRPIPDSIAKNFWVARIPDGGASAAWKKKGQDGVEFFAIGNEPFWSLEIDNERGVSFKPADLPKAITFTAGEPRSDKDSTVYSLSNAGSKIEITIYNEFCSDGMSDNLYEQRVHIRYKGQTFKGCGSYLKR